MAKKKNFKRKKRKKSKDRVYFGFPWPLIQQQSVVKVGTEFKCERCGAYHVLQDGSREYPEAKEGEILIYQCCARWMIGGIKGYSVVGLEDKLNPTIRMANLLSDMTHIFMPFAIMVAQAEQEIKKENLLERGDELLPKLTIPLAVARQIRYIMMKSNNLLNELKFVETVDVEQIQIEMEKASPKESMLWLPDDMGDISLPS